MRSCDASSLARLARLSCVWSVIRTMSALAPIEGLRCRQTCVLHAGLRPEHAFAEMKERRRGSYLKVS